MGWSNNELTKEAGVNPWGLRHELATRTTSAKAAVATLDSDLEKVRAALDHIAQDAYANPIAIDSATGLLRNYSYEAAALKDAAVGMVRDSGGTVRDLVESYEEILINRLKSLAEMGYDPPTELDAGNSDPDIPSKGTDPQQVNDWWEGLSPYQQRELIAEHPEQIGSLDGIPAVARDQANRSVLASEITRIDEQIAKLEREEHNPIAKLETLVLEEQREDLAAIEKRLDTPVGNGKQQAFLLGFDPDGNGKAIVAMGDPDTADNIVTFVPGTGAGLSSVSGYMERADLMATEANRLDPGSSTSSIMWIGYEAPQDIAKFPPGSGGAIDSGFAKRGAPALDSFQDGLRATHAEGTRSHNTVLGHSYGSTVVGYTAKDHGLDADDMIFVGSPGVGVEKASELGIDGDHVWSSHARNDPIQLGVDVGDVLTNKRQVDLVHGRNPSDPDFGGRTFTSDPGKPLVTWKEHSVGPIPLPSTPQFHADAHSQYWDEGSSSLDNMTAIITDKDHLVT